MVVSLAIKAWSAKKHDKKVTQEVLDDHHAASDAGKFNKQLASKKSMEALQKIVGEARQYHYEVTLPWGENGERLLPSENYFEYTAKMSSFKGSYEHEVMLFLSKYDSVVQEAQRSLGDLFVQNDYPSPTDIAKKFSFKTTFMPVPQNDWRVEFGQDEIAKLKVNMEQEFNTRLGDATKDIWSRIHEQLVYMHKRLTEFSRDEDTGTVKMATFRDSLFENLKSLVDVLPKLNITHDQAITDACEDLSKILANPDDVRKDVNLRNEKAKAVGDVLQKFEGFFQ